MSASQHRALRADSIEFEPVSDENSVSAASLALEGDDLQREERCLHVRSSNHYAARAECFFDLVADLSISFVTMHSSMDARRTWLAHSPHVRAAEAPCMPSNGAPRHLDSAAFHAVWPSHQHSVAFRGLVLNSRFNYCSSPSPPFPAC